MRSQIKTVPFFFSFFYALNKDGLSYTQSSTSTPYEHCTATLQQLRREAFTLLDRKSPGFCHTNCAQRNLFCHSSSPLKLYLYRNKQIFNSALKQFIINLAYYEWIAQPLWVACPACCTGAMHSRSSRVTPFIQWRMKQHNTNNKLYY